jgi:PTH1 family peptidyl-tRNA hydrolase
MKLIVGLGNPGKKYQSTKHNIGFMCLDSYFRTNKHKFKKDKKFNGLVLKIGNTVFLKPHTFMNNSGQSIKSAIDFYNIELEDILVIYDDLDLPLGKTRLREQGSAGGHNGIKSIINHIKTDEFKRVRVGIDSNPLIETKNYVLGKFSKDELKIIELTIEKVEKIISDFSNNQSFLNIMNNYN